MAARKSTKYLVVHVTATKPDQDIGVKEVRTMHKARGFADIGYNRLIRLDGKVEIGRGDDAIGAHVEGFNSVAWGIALAGGLNAKGKPANTMTAAQEAALEAALRAALKKYPNAVICGHRDLSPDKDGDGIVEPQEHTKACPCFDVIPWAQAKGLPAAPIKGVWLGDPARGSASIQKPVGPDDRNVYLQRLLARAGFSFGAIDGWVGPKTEKAIRAYQLSVGLTQSGKFDAATVRKLRATFEVPAAKAA